MRTSQGSGAVRDLLGTDWHVTVPAPGGGWVAGPAELRATLDEICRERVDIEFVTPPNP